MLATVVSAATFGQEVLAATIPVLVEFCAERPPIKAMTPALDEVANELEGKVKVARVDVDRYSTFKREYEIRGLPTLILFKSGKPVARRVGGLVQKDEIKEWINAALILALATRRTAAARRASGFKLSNGMDVVVIPDHRAPIVTHMVWYRVGAADEPEGSSGIARLLQHLTFKSMDKTAVGAFAKTISRLGGEFNASSGRDATNYILRISRDQLKSAMEMEADRMVRLSVTEEELAIEREVVMELRRSTVEYSAVARLSEEVDALLYRGHPHGIPVTGMPDEIAKLTLDDLSRFHKLHYAPNNAILVISGDVTLDDVKGLAKETYGKIPANSRVGGRSRPQAPVHIAAHRVITESLRTGTAEFGRRFAVPGRVAARPGEAEALEVLAKVLGGGVSSRLYRRLVVEDKSASLVNTSYSGAAVDSGNISIHAIASGDDLGAVEAGVDAVISDIRKNGVTEIEIGCAKSGLLANYIYDGSDQTKLACRYGSALAIGLTIDEVEGWPAAISKVTAAEIKKAANTYLIDRRAVTGWLVPSKGVRRSAVLGLAYS